MFKKIYIEITNICNLNCKFCPDTKRIKKNMSLQEFTKIINKIKGYTNLVYLHVKGEPLLNDNLPLFLDVLENNNLLCNITTNGILLKEKVDILNKSKAVRQVNISLHSAIQNDLDVDKYMDNILNAVDKLNNKIISLRLWNLKDIKDNDLNDKIINKLSTHYKIDNLKEKLKENNSIKVKNDIYINQDMEFIWPDINSKEINKEGRCLALKDQIAILVDGTVVPCCLDNNGDIPLGNIFAESLEDILNKDITKKIKNSFENKKIVCKLCKTCGFLKRLEDKRK